MSSRSRTRSERRRLPAAALLLALIAVQWFGPAAAAAPVPLPVAAVLVGGAQTSLVVDLSASTPSGRRSVSVTRDGAPQRAQLVPVVSDGLAVALVVDTSAAGAATLPAWLSAGARFILEAPATTQAVVIADSAPAAAITGPQRGPTGVVRALTDVRARGERDTAAALTLAMRQFPATAAGRRVVVLYTTGADAGGESAAALAARFRASGTILVVVGTAGGDPYWSAAAAATGGFFAPAGDPVVIPALDQVETTLRGRYLVQFPTPPRLPARVSVRVDTGDLTLTGDPIVARPPAPAPRSAWDNLWIPAAAVVVGLAAVGLVAVVLLRRRRRSRQSGGDGPAGGDLPSLAVARGRAAVPGAVARGRAIVPGTVSPPPPD
jgi:von Willebrand factor type A domain